MVAGRARRARELFALLFPECNLSSLMYAVRARRNFTSTLSIRCTTIVNRPHTIAEEGLRIRG